MFIQPANHNHFDTVIKLLGDNSLPIEDLSSTSGNFWVAIDQEQVIGAIGLEQYGQDGLLRSAVVDGAFRNQGIAGKLTNTLFEGATKLGIRDIYLLTETAKDYFQRKGFSVIERTAIPSTIQSSQEFSHLCASSATVMHKAVNFTKRLLFVCVENSNRSQMSQAFAKLHGGEKVEAYSAGSKPSGIVNPKAIAAMQQLGYDLSSHDSKSLDEVKQYAPYDVVVTMGCGDACPWMPAKQFVDWQIPDPRNMEPEAFNQVRDLISEKVKALIQSII